MAKQQKQGRVVRVKQVPQALLRSADVQTVTGLSRSTLYRFMGDGTFPRPVKLGERAVAWRAADVGSWVNERQVAAA